MLNIVMLSFTWLSVIMLNAVVLSVVLPKASKIAVDNVWPYYSGAANDTQIGEY